MGHATGTGNGIERLGGRTSGSHREFTSVVDWIKRLKLARTVAGFPPCHSWAGGDGNWT